MQVKIYLFILLFFIPTACVFHFVLWLWISSVSDWVCNASFYLVSKDIPSVFCEILGSHSSEHEDGCLLGCYIV
jgi:hypothetical protein